MHEFYRTYMDNYLAQFKTIILIVIPKKKGAKIKQKCSFKELIDYVYVIIPCTFSNINCFQYVPKISFNYCIKNDKSNILTWILMNMINGKQFMYYSNLSHPYYSQLHICWKYIYIYIYIYGLTAVKTSKDAARLLAEI